MELIEHLSLGFSVAFTGQNLLYAFVGCLLGTLIGVLPGLGPLATIAMLLPVTYGLEPVSALIMLAGIYYGAQYGGSTTAILVNLPDGVTFAVDSISISPSFQTTLDQIATSLKTYPDSLVDVYGHTDSTGSDAYNQNLSERRAKAVADYLAMRGVSSARIRWQGFGEQYPVASNDTAEGRSLNRRVEIQLSPLT